MYKDELLTQLRWSPKFKFYLTCSMQVMNMQVQILCSLITKTRIVTPVRTYSTNVMYIKATPLNNVFYRNVLSSM